MKCLYVLINTLIINSFLVSPIIHAQPAVEFTRLYNFREVDHFMDIYALSDGNIIACGDSEVRLVSQHSSGDMWIVKMRSSGHEIWSRTYGVDNTYDMAYSLIETDNENVVVVGYNYDNVLRNSFMEALMIDQDGEVIWRNIYGEGKLEGVIELKNGLLLCCGKNDTEGVLLFLNQDGREIATAEYGDNHGNVKFHAVREVDGGYLVGGEVGGRVGDRWVNYGFLMKLDVNLEEQWRQVFQIDENSTNVWSMTSDGEGGAVLVGQWHNIEGDPMYADNYRYYSFAARFNGEGEQLWTLSFDLAEVNNREDFLSVVRLHDSGYLLVGRAVHGEAGQVISDAVRIDAHTNERWRHYYDDYEMSQFFSVTHDRDNNILAAGYAVVNDVDEQNIRDGWIIKLAPDLLEPQVLIYLPEDTTLTVLQGDTVRFAVSVRDPHGRDIEITWSDEEENVLGRDTTITRTFNDIGQFLVTCRASNGEEETAVTWHITVTDLYIASFTPDSTAFSIRRGSSLDFGLDYRATDNGPVTIDWYKSDEGDGFPISHDPNTTLTFDFTGDVRVEGLVYRGETEDNVIWDISVRSVVSVFRPEIRNITAYMDTIITFSVEPFNPESPNLSYYWMLDGDTISYIQEFEWDFDEPREYSVIAYIYDGVEGDTLVWNVTVLPNAAGGGIGIPPYAAGLTAYPNPFNSSTTITYNLPQASEIKLQLIDISGRIVENLVDGMQTSGNHSINLNSGSLSNGIYFVRLSGVGFSEVQKIIVLK